MTPEEALAFIDSSADSGLGAPDYGEAYSIVKESLARVAELEAEREGYTAMHSADLNTIADLQRQLAAR